MRNHLIQAIGPSFRLRQGFVATSRGYDSVVRNDRRVRPRKGYGEKILWRKRQSLRLYEKRESQIWNQYCPINLRPN
jgi:hypothetical protein